MTDKKEVYPESVSVNRVCFCNSDNLSSDISKYLSKVRKLPVDLFDKYQRKRISGVERVITYSDGENLRVYVSDAGFVDGVRVIDTKGNRLKTLIGIYDFCKGDLENLSQPREQTENHEFS